MHSQNSAFHSRPQQQWNAKPGLSPWTLPAPGAVRLVANLQFTAPLFFCCIWNIKFPIQSLLAVSLWTTSSIFKRKTSTWPQHMRLTVNLMESVSAHNRVLLWAFPQARTCSCNMCAEIYKKIFIFFCEQCMSIPLISLEVQLDFVFQDQHLHAQFLQQSEEKCWVVVGIISRILTMRCNSKTGATVGRAEVATEWTLSSVLLL